ncbi:MAG TPA: hypothetical protein VFI38_01920 [Candidatus Acidoferrum sp.]|nr:hypothetical protein [Candidatus Acidoferrum sp.]
MLEAEKVDLSIPVDTSAAYGGSQQKMSTGVSKQVASEEYEEQEQKCVWEGNDALKRDFVRASLRECGIPSESSLEGQSYRVFVGDAVHRKAVATIKEIVEGTPPSFEPPDRESRAETSFAKYQMFFCSLLTGLMAPIALLFLVQFVADSYLAVQLLKLLTGCAALGALWTGYQALRYERRPGLYVLMAILPLSFIWYYLGRYKPRTAEVTGPSFDQPSE